MSARAYPAPASKAPTCRAGSLNSKIYLAQRRLIALELNTAGEGQQQINEGRSILGIEAPRILDRHDDRSGSAVPRDNRRPSTFGGIDQRRELRLRIANLDGFHV